MPIKYIKTIKSYSKHSHEYNSIYYILLNIMYIYNTLFICFNLYKTKNFSHKYYCVNY